MLRFAFITEKKYINKIISAICHQINLFTQVGGIDVGCVAETNKNTIIYLNNNPRSPAQKTSDSFYHPSLIGVCILFHTISEYIHLIILHQWLQLSKQQVKHIQIQKPHYVRLLELLKEHHMMYFFG